MLEKAQVKAPEMTTSLKGTTCKERRKEGRLNAQEERRKRQDISQVFKY
jgi:hypothetical protein